MKFYQYVSTGHAESGGEGREIFSGKNALT